MPHFSAISVQMEPDDYICPYYRDRALVLGRGVASRELALDYMAKRKGQSGGRQTSSPQRELLWTLTRISGGGWESNPPATVTAAQRF